MIWAAIKIDCDVGHGNDSSVFFFYFSVFIRIFGKLSSSFYSVFFCLILNSHAELQLVLIPAKAILPNDSENIGTFVGILNTAQKINLIRVGHNKKGGGDYIIMHAMHM